MKLFQYDFYFGACLARKTAPEKNPYRDAVSAQAIYIGVFSMSVMFRLAMELDIWHWLMANWPYEYGKVHSKNFIAPTGILAIVTYVVSGIVLKKYFLRQSLINRLDEIFGMEDPAITIHVFLPRFLLFFFLFYGVMIAGAYWVVVALCTAIVIALELWIRYRFFWNREELLQQPYAQKLLAEREKASKKKRK